MRGVRSVLVGAFGSSTSRSPQSTYQYLSEDRAIVTSVGIRATVAREVILVSLVSRLVFISYSPEKKIAPQKELIPLSKPRCAFQSVSFGLLN